MQFPLKSKPPIFFRSILIGFHILFLSSILIPQKTCHAGPSASSVFQDAKGHFKGGEYQQALALFKQAQALGLNKPALYYNIGVCFFKLKRYEEANRAFLNAATFPQMAPLAYYNLAVIAEKQKNPDEAIFWLQKSLAHADPKEKKLILLAKTALSRVEIRSGAVNSWLHYASLGVGYDDNVAMLENTDLELTSNKADSFTEIFAFTRSPFLVNSPLKGAYFQGSLSSRDYTDLNEFDTSIVQFDARYRKKIDLFQLEGSAGYNYVHWDRKSYSQSPVFSIQAKRFIGKNSNFRLRYEAKYHDILDNDFYYLQGWQHRASLEFSTSSDLYRVLYGYSYEKNNRDGNRFSPRRHLIHATCELHPSKRTALSLTTSYRNSDYTHSDNNRTDDRYEGSLRLLYSLTKKLELSILATHTINISTFPLYDYKRTVSSMNLGYSF